MQKWRPILYALLQIVVFLLIATPHITCTALIIPGWFDFKWNRTKCIIALIALNIGCFHIYLNYALACFTDPGKIPLHYKPPDLKSIGNKQALRKCKHCKVYKPPRAHHCKECGRCVLKMDHHCPWLNNCVGFRNHGHFMRFLFWVTATTLCLFVMLVFRGRELLWEISGNYMALSYFHETLRSEMILIIVDLVIAGAVFLSVGILFIMQLWNLLGNATTIEGWEQDRVQVMVRRNIVKEYVYPFDVDWLSNLKSVLGPSILFWWIPQRMRGNGIDYAKYPGTETVKWPPEEYTIEQNDYRHTGRHDSDSDHDDANKGSKTTGSAVIASTSGDPDDSDDDTPLATHLRPPGSRHWRRGSEGYIVEQLGADHYQ